MWFHAFLLFLLSKIVIALVEWTTLRGEIQQTFIELSTNHFDSLSTSKIRIRILKQGTFPQNVWILPQQIAQLPEDALSSIEIPNATKFAIEQRGTTLQHFPHDPNIYSLQNAAMDLIELSRLFKVKMLVGESFGSLLGYTAYKLAPTDFFTSVLFLNFMPYFATQHSDFSTRLDVKTKFKKICLRDQQCQSILCEKDAWNNDLFGSLEASSTSCTRSLNVLMNRIQFMRDKRHFIRLASKLISRRYPHPKAVLNLYRVLSDCTNIKLFSRLVGAEIGDLRLFPCKEPSTYKEVFEQTAKAYFWIGKSYPVTHLRYLIETSEGSSNSSCTVQDSSFISICDSLLPTLKEPFLTYKPLEIPLKTVPCKTRFLVLCGALSMNELSELSQYEFHKIPSINKYFFESDNHTSIHELDREIWNLTWPVFFNTNTVFDLENYMKRINKQPLDWEQMVKTYDQPLHGIVGPDGNTWYLYTVLMMISIAMPVVHFTYIYTKNF